MYNKLFNEKNNLGVIKTETKNNNLTNSDIPLGLGMAFAQNVEAMKYFSSLSESERQAVITRAHEIKSKAEMQAFVASLGAVN